MKTNNEEVLKRFREKFGKYQYPDSKEEPIFRNMDILNPNIVEQFLISELNRRERETAEELIDSLQVMKKDYGDYLYGVNEYDTPGKPLHYSDAINNILATIKSKYLSGDGRNKKNEENNHK